MSVFFFFKIKLNLDFRTKSQKLDPHFWKIILLIVLSFWQIYISSTISNQNAYHEEVTAFGMGGGKARTLLVGGSVYHSVGWTNSGRLETDGRVVAPILGPQWVSTMFLLLQKEKKNLKWI